MIHIREDVINDKDQIDPKAMDQVARMGGSWYSRAAQGLFELSQPTAIKNGFDSLPQEVKTSVYLTGNDLARLLEVDEIPNLPITGQSRETLEDRHLRAKELIEHNDIEAAWNILLS